jgi:O-antigen ligase
VTAPLPDLPLGTLAPAPAPTPASQSILYGLTGLLMISVLAFGTVEPWAIFLLQATSAVLVLLWTIEQLRSTPFHVRSSPLFRPMLAFAGLLAIQLLPGRSAYWHATYVQMLRFIAYGMICFLLTQTLTDTRQLRKIGSAFTIFGAGVAAFAVLENLSSPHKLYWLRTPRQGGWIYGPYVNHNHYAGLMEMLFPIPLVFACSRLGRRRERWLAASAAGLMSATIFLSGSRGGMMAFAVQIAVFLYFLFGERRKQDVRLFGSVFLLISLVVVAASGGREVPSRIATLDADRHADLRSDVRIKIDRDIWPMVFSRPMLGWGQGSFAEVYPRFRSFYTDSLVNAAHNDYLQLLSETGIAGFGIMVWFVVNSYRAGMRKSRRWRADSNAAAAVAAMVGISGILAHSVVDFNLQIAANAALFYSLSTVAAIEPSYPQITATAGPRGTGICRWTL